MREVIFTITCDGNQLFGEVSFEAERIELLAETDNHFWFSSRPMEITFNRDENATVCGIAKERQA